MYMWKIIYSSIPFLFGIWFIVDDNHLNESLRIYGKYIKEYGLLKV